MTIYVKNKFISFTGASKVYDENENPLYQVKGQLFTFTKRKRVQTLEGENLFIVRNKLIHFIRRKAYIYDGNKKLIATVIKRFSLKEGFLIEGTDKPLEIQGNFWGWNFKIIYGDRQIGTITRKFALADKFAIDINSQEDAPFLVALVIAIDNIYDKKYEQQD